MKNTEKKKEKAKVVDKAAENTPQIKPKRKKQSTRYSKQKGMPG